MNTSRIGTTDPNLLQAKTEDKPLSLKPGELVRAQVVNTLPNGNVSLRIKGSVIEVKSSVEVPRDASVLIRVVGNRTSEGGGELRLRLLEVNADPSDRAVMRSFAADEIQGLSNKLEAVLSGTGSIRDGLDAITEQLLKALPEDAATLPTGLRQQLQDLLENGLMSSQQAIQDRLATLFNDSLLSQLPEGLELVNIKDNLYGDMKEGIAIPLKSMLENTGVGLESRLKQLVQSIEEQGGLFTSDPYQAEVADQPLLAGFLKTDLKGRLLQIKQRLLEQQGQPLSEPGSSHAANPKEGEQSSKITNHLTHAVDGLLKDIEVLQLISKLTDSFYTFLPFQWDGLREGHIAFKRNEVGADGRSYYCLMNLDFENLGKLTIVAMLQAKDIFVSFKTDNADFRSVLNKNIEELKKVFPGMGLSLKAVNFLNREEDHLAQFEHLESFENIINIRV